MGAFGMSELVVGLRLLVDCGPRVGWQMATVKSLDSKKMTVKIDEREATVQYQLNGQGIIWKMSDGSILDTGIPVPVKKQKRGKAKL
jgi:hypothetical protein